MANHAKPRTRTFTEKLLAWCADTSPAARFERTVVQGSLGVCAALVAQHNGFLPEWAQLAVVPIVMAVLSPLQALIATSSTEDVRELYVPKRGDE